MGEACGSAPPPVWLGRESSLAKGLAVRLVLSLQEPGAEGCSPPGLGEAAPWGSEGRTRGTAQGFGAENALPHGPAHLLNQLESEL